MQKTSAEILFQNKKIVPKEFNKVANKYDFATAMSQGYQEDLNRSGNLLKLQGNETMIDLCCGTGKSTLSFLPKIINGKVICIDNSEGMLEVAKEKFDYEIKTGKVEISLQDAMDLKIAPNSIDAIFMAYGLRNMPDYAKCVTNLHTILKPGGQLVIHDYSLREAWYVKPLWAVLGYGFIVPFCTVVSGSANIYTYLIKSVLNFLNPTEIKCLLENKGFEYVTVHNHPSWRSLFFHSFRAVKK